MSEPTPMSENPGKSAILAALADLSETISRTFGALERSSGSFVSLVNNLDTRVDRLERVERLESAGCSSWGVDVPGFTEFLLGFRGAVRSLTRCA